METLSPFNCGERTGKHTAYITKQVSAENIYSLSALENGSKISSRPEPHNMMLKNRQMPMNKHLAPLGATRANLVPDVHLAGIAVISIRTEGRLRQRRCASQQDLALAVLDESRSSQKHFIVR
jgi:hypothetical protein